MACGVVQPGPLIARQIANNREDVPRTCYLSQRPKNSHLSKLVTPFAWSTRARAKVSVKLPTAHVQGMSTFSWTNTLSV
ncbi:unnamed protein product [Heligmosomoides polygyrus]|uniref:Uncharacterized protein n=1 Tax=Heligmosomoides polygyrus TaxID=6339 RepID=A0A183FTG8_HELPZ|nr:unnamed protein product [Heligmosomoides polygyrus]